MADICAVCNKKVNWLSITNAGMYHSEDNLVTHFKCNDAFLENPEKYGGSERVHKTHKQKVEDKSVYVKGFNII